MNEAFLTNGLSFKRDGNIITFTYSTEAEALQAYVRMVKGFNLMNLIKKE